MVNNEKAIEKRAKLIIKYRKMKIQKKEKNGDFITYHLMRGGNKYLMQCVSNQRNVGIAYIRELNELLNETEAKGGIMLTDSKYTYSARYNAPKLNVELVPSTIPSFDLFKHKLVSPAEILNEEERDAVLDKYHAKPYQFPKMKTKDPISIIIGAKSGDIVRFKQNSETSGYNETYRYVI